MMFCYLDIEIWTIKRFTDVGIIKVTHNFNIIQLLISLCLDKKKINVFTNKRKLTIKLLLFFFFLGFCCYCVSVLSEKDLLFLTPVDNK